MESKQPTKKRELELEEILNEHIRSGGEVRKIKKETRESANKSKDRPDNNLCRRVSTPDICYTMEGKQESHPNNEDDIAKINENSL